MAKHSEKSDDELLTMLGAQVGQSGRICRQRFGWGNKKSCALPRGHKGKHRQ